MQTFRFQCIRQIANFRVYATIAICNHLGMTFPSRRLAIAQAPRPWISRRLGECAYPVDGEGMATRSCCNPCGEAVYCAPHAAAMRGPPVSSVADLEREIMRFLEQRP
jgi:hypothetical protein